MSLNKVFLIGHVGQDPKEKEFPSGATLSEFSLATNETFKGKDGEKKQKTTWHHCKAWNQKADLCNTYLKKGSKVFISGKIDVEKWETEDGEKRSLGKIQVNEVVFLDNKEEGDSQDSQSKKPKTTKKKESKQQKFPDIKNVETNQDFTSDNIPF